MKWEIWVTPDGNEITVLPVDHPRHTQLTAGHQRMDHFEASSLEEALVFKDRWLETYDCRSGG